jgi:uncharacterized protein
MSRSPDNPTEPNVILNNELKGEIMQGSFYRFYVHEGQNIHHRPAWEWLLYQANKQGIRGGSAFKAIAGFGRHHVLHEASFFELAGTITVEVEFLMTDQEAQAFINLLHQEKLRLFYARTPAYFGVINPDTRDPPSVVAIAAEETGSWESLGRKQPE